MNSVEAKCVKGHTFRLDSAGSNACPRCGGETEGSRGFTYTKSGKIEKIIKRPALVNWAISFFRALGL